MCFVAWQEGIGTDETGLETEEGGGVSSISPHEKKNIQNVNRSIELSNTDCNIMTWAASHAATSWKQTQETFNAIHHNYTYSTMQEKAVNDQSATEGKYLVLNDPINILPHKWIGHYHQ